VSNTTVTIIATLFIGTIFLTGCSGDPEVESWEIMEQIQFGRQPKWSPEGELILFGDDRPGRAGLWLWNLSDDPTLLADDLPPHNWDYCWSNSGDRIAFSVPGEDGEGSTGIWVMDVAARSAEKLSDRGENVSWYYSDEYIAANIAHPQNGENLIAMINVSNLESTYLALGYKPVCSPEQDLIAFSDKEYSNNQRNGKLWVKPFEGDDTLTAVSGTGAVQWDWSGSDLICISNSYLNPPYLLTGWLLKFSSTEDGWGVDTLAEACAYPTVDYSGDQIAFMRESNSRWIGLWIYQNGSDVRIADYVMNPDFHPSEDKIAVNGLAGGIKVLQRMR